VPGLDGARINIYRQDQRDHRRRELAGEQHLPAIEAIDRISGRGADDQERDAGSESDDADERR
jgi:hypothetical protein